MNRALVLDPRSPAAHSGMGYLLASLGKTKEAVTHLERAVQLDPSDPVAKDNLQRVRDFLQQPAGSPAAASSEPPATPSPEPGPPAALRESAPTAPPAPVSATPPPPEPAPQPAAEPPKVRELQLPPVTVSAPPPEPAPKAPAAQPAAPRTYERPDSADELSTELKRRKIRTTR
jgi:hypothetical protein